MVGRITKILSIALLIVICACSKNISISNIDDLEGNFKNINELKKVDASNLLREGTEVLPYKKGFSFLPAEIVSDEMILGELTNDLDSTEIYLCMYNVNKKEYTLIKKFTPKFDYSSIQALACNAEYIVYAEYSLIGYEAGGYDVEFYLYDISEEKHISIFKPSQGGAIRSSQVQIYNDNIYWDFMDEEGFFHIYEYNIKNKTSKEFLDGDYAELPYIFDEIMYYTSVRYVDEDHPLASQFIAYDMKKDNKTVLYEVDWDEGQFIAVSGERNNILLSVIRKNENETLYSDIYIYRSDEEKMNPYLTGSIVMETPILKGDYLRYTEIGREDRCKTAYGLIDIDKNIYYEYDDGIILTGEKGILWNKFLRDNCSIPKGAKDEGNYSWRYSMIK